MKMFKMDVLYKGKVIMTHDSNDASGIIRACERWTDRGYEVKLYKSKLTELDWKGK